MSLLLIQVQLAMDITQQLPVSDNINIRQSTTTMEPVHITTRSNDMDSSYMTTGDDEKSTLSSVAQTMMEALTTALMDSNGLNSIATQNETESMLESKMVTMEINGTTTTTTVMPPPSTTPAEDEEHGNFEIILPIIFGLFMALALNMVVFYVYDDARVKPKRLP